MLGFALVLGAVPAGAQIGGLPVVTAADPELTAARAAADGGRWAEAEGRLRQYLGARPGSAEALYLLGATLFHERKAKESLEVYTRAAQVRRPSASDFRMVALDYVLLGDYTDADTWITRAAQENPADGETWYEMGRIRQTDNRFAEAITCFSKALERLPRLVKAEDNMGLSYEGLNRPDDAIKAYRQAIAWQKDDPHPSAQPYLNLGTLLVDRNQGEEALSLLQQAAALTPADPKVHGALGKLYVRRGELPMAQAELEKAVAGDPENAGLHFQLGQVYRRLNMGERAAAEMQRAAALEAKGRR